MLKSLREEVAELEHGVAKLEQELAREESLYAEYPEAGRTATDVVELTTENPLYHHHREISPFGTSTQEEVAVGTDRGGDEDRTRVEEEQVHLCFS